MPTCSPSEKAKKPSTSLPDEKRTALADKRNGGSSDKDALYVASREVERLDAYRQTLMLEKVPEDQQFGRLKALFSADVDARAAAADKTDTELANAFAFLDAAIPDSQELVLFATELDRKLVYLVVYPELRVRCVFRA